MRPVSPAAFAETVAPGRCGATVNDRGRLPTLSVDLLLSTVRCEELATQVIPVNT